MKKIIVFGASNSKKSINKELAVYASSFLTDIEKKILDLNDFSTPTYSIDFENENGVPEEAKNLLTEIKNTDGILVSFAEHNSNFTAAFKNIFDWMSRIEPKLWNDKPMLLMATSPGKRGGLNVLNLANSIFPRMGANIVASFSLPSFNQNFQKKSIVDEELKNELQEKVTLFEESL